MSTTQERCSLNREVMVLVYVNLHNAKPYLEKLRIWFSEAEYTPNPKSQSTTTLVPWIKHSNKEEKNPSSPCQRVSSLFPKHNEISSMFLLQLCPNYTQSRKSCTVLGLFYKTLCTSESPCAEGSAHRAALSAYCTECQYPH